MPRGYQWHRIWGAQAERNGHGTCPIVSSGAVVWCGVVWCGAVRCGIVWCGVPKALLPEGNGRDVYPQVQVNGRAVCVVRALCVSVWFWGGRRGSRGNLVVTPLATVFIPGAPAVPPLSPLAGAGVAPAIPTPWCGVVWCGVVWCGVV